ncbi:AraC family transcriptional regulator [Lactobacillus mulieris]|uniref:helix-turn-helix domain-containing protein n=1 Tax=Lactobacillus mulieris TaxID=2508708 RepID=UPI001432D0BA|nr:AraC family transcriptional regulator [Lactobacillus mulieris]MCF1783654.1 AraC family transcriptional regulator [Lactobacillus mulieris]MCW8104258.1 AraC family transcriptional regulator [Lactobacillus mulieris]MDK6803119.1 AraC family transcriptional regulator [Lactobacillus mulieris]MDK8382235.1 AraC family transcriptional regulator [Lactobacillus mulieris]MDT9620377.1 AraC family transcriptional regulator [Lactobacillus mulieris]
MNFDIQYYFKKLATATNVPIFIFSKSGKLISAYKPAPVPLFPHEILNKALSKFENESIILYTLNNTESFILLKLHKFNVILWNCHHTMQTSGFYKDVFPGIGTKKLINLSEAIFYSLTHKKANILYFTEPINLSTYKLTSSNLLAEQEQTFVHNSYLIEKKVFSAIKKADLKSFELNSILLLKSGATGKMACHDLRNKKDTIIAFITLATRAAIEGGLTPEKAYALSDDMCQKVEQMSTIHSVSTMTNQIGSLFIETLLRAQIQNDGDLLVYKVNRILKKNIYQSFSLSLIASQLHLSPSYLCTAYKKKTGKTISSINNDFKLDAARDLLIYSDTSIGEIANLLGFSSQTYFTQLFKHQFSTTPLKYRNAFHIAY